MVVGTPECSNLKAQIYCFFLFYKVSLFAIMALNYSIKEESWVYPCPSTWPNRELPSQRHVASYAAHVKLCQATCENQQNLLINNQQKHF